LFPILSIVNRVVDDGCAVEWQTHFNSTSL
jgi:hypothetical protein